MKYCKKCNYMNDDYTNVCVNCGTVFDEPVNHVPPQNNYSGYNNAPGNNVPPSNYYSGYNGAPGNGGNGQPGFNYGMPNNTPYNMQQSYAPAKAYTNTIPIAAIILSVLTSNVIGIVLSVIALVKFNEYEKSRQYGANMNIESAKLSRKLGIAGIVISVLGIVISVISIIISSLLGLGMWAGLFEEIFSEAYEYYSDYIFIAPLF